MSAARNVVRIIGGAWRGRRVGFVPQGVRPTPDRVRETLFNWLQGAVAGTRVLDLCAGSGVLGFEALSRGAHHAVLVDSSSAVTAQLARVAAQLGTRQAQVQRRDALAFVQALRGGAEAFDLVFLDPPYASGLHGACLAALAAPGVLSPSARIYLELPAAQPPLAPDGWLVHRSGRAGQVGYHLLARATAAAREGEQQCLPSSIQGLSTLSPMATPT